MLIKLQISQEIFEKYVNIIKIRPLGADFFRKERRTNRQTHMTKLLVAFHDLANVLKNIGKIFIACNVLFCLDGHISEDEVGGTIGKYKEM